MKYAYHSEYKTAFTKIVEATGRIHALIPKGELGKMDSSNALIGLITTTSFTKLGLLIQRIENINSNYGWEMEYNNHRPHQGIDNLTPLQKAQKQHPIWMKFAMV